jgi:hypothetical protein
MTTRDELIDFMMNDYDIFNPRITFDGDFIFQNIVLDNYNPNKDILVLNSKIDSNGNNMYQKFVNSTYVESVNLHLVEGLSKKSIHPLLYSTLDDDGKNRVLKYSYFITVRNIMKDVPNTYGHLTEKEIIEVSRTWFKEQIKKMQDFKRNGYNSIYIDEILKAVMNENDLNALYANKTESEIIECRKELCAKLNMEKINLCLEMYKSLSVSLRYMMQEIDRNATVNLSSFKKCFDEDKLLLLTMKVILNNQYKTIKGHNNHEPSLIEVTNFMNAIKEFGVKDFNPVIKIYDENKGIINYSFKDLVAEYNKILSRLDHYNTIVIGDDKIEKMGLSHDIDAINVFRKLFSEDEEKVIRTNWDLIQSGEKDIEYDLSKRKQSSGEGNRKRIDEDEIIYRRYIFQQTNYSAQIVGKEKFEGYVGYVYENGLVVFEKFYEEGGKIAQMQATYVMNYKNFVEFTKLSKPEILEYIKNTDNTDVTRLYHTKNWANNLKTQIEGVEPTMESQIFVSSLETSDVKKREKKQ